MKSDGLVIIVNYNQGIEVSDFLQELLKYHQIEHMIFIDDGSSDQSVDIARSFQLNIITHDKNLGVGAAIRTGINYAHNHEYKYVIIMSSNGKMLPSELHRFKTPILSGEYDYITGSRYLAGGSSPGISQFRKLSIPMFSWFFYLLIGRKFSDITCGYRCYNIDFLYSDQLDIEQEWLNTYEMEYYIHYHAVKKNLKIQEVPVTIKYDHLQLGRKSKIKPIIGWWKMIRPLIYLKLGIKK